VIISAAFVILVVIVGLFLALKIALLTDLGRTVLLARPMRNQAAKQVGAGITLTPVAEIPLELDATIRILKSHGFVMAVIGNESTRRITSILIDPRESVVAQLVWRQRRRDGHPRTVVDLISFVSGRRGILSTSNAGFSHGWWAMEVDQVVPNASMDVLVATHEKARCFLVGNGVRFEVVTPDDVLESMTWIRDQSLTALLDLPDDSLLAIQGTVARESRTLASMLEDPEILERTRAFAS